MVDWNKTLEVAITAGGSGLASFGGAFLRFKQRLSLAEARAGEAVARADELEKALRVAQTSLQTLQQNFDAFTRDYARDQRHRDDLEKARAEARQSYPDPAEIFRQDIDALKRAVERVKERQASFVRNDTFVEHTRAQEQQWRTLERTLGQLETLVKQL